MIIERLKVLRHGIGPSPEERCTIIEDSLDDPSGFERELEALAFNLGVIGVDEETIQEIIECMERVFGLQTE